VQNLSAPLDETIKIREEGISMSLTGTCKNCLRENMSLPANGMCGRCNYAIRNTPEEEKEVALANARESATTGTRSKRGPKKIIKKVVADTPAVEFTERLMPKDLLSAKADKAIALKRLLDDVSEETSESHLKIVIMAAILDAYRDGRKSNDATNPV
jgi:hypothetical protein